VRRLSLSLYSFAPQRSHVLTIGHCHTVYLHKPAFAQALLKNSDEPLKSPWAASVAAVSLETAVYLLAIAKSWTRLHPICARWWQCVDLSFSLSFPRTLSSESCARALSGLSQDLG